MTPADARALRRRRAADLRDAEPGLSLRKMARRLGVSRDTVARDLEEHDRRAAESAPPVEVAAAEVAEAAPPAEDVAEAVDHSAPLVESISAGAVGERGVAADSAPQASDVVAESAPPAEVAAAEVAEAAPPAEDVADVVAHRAPLPRRLADTALTIDLRQWPALRRDLAVLAETGVSAEALINQAVVVLAHGYRQGVRIGAIRRDRPFVVRDLIVGPPRSHRPRRPLAPAEGSPGA